MKDLRKIKKIIIFLLIICIIIISTICFINYKEKNKQTKPKEVKQATIEFKTVTDYNMYYSVKNILNNYVVNIKEYNGDTSIPFEKIGNKEETIKKINNEVIDIFYNTLNKDYLEMFNVSRDDIKKKIEKYKIKGNYKEDIDYDLKIKEMHEAKISSNISTILVSFQINNKEEEKILLKLDLNNNTYNAYGRDYIEQKKYNESAHILESDINDDSIENNNYNSFNYINADDKYIINQYFNEYKDNLLNNQNYAYELLDEEYKEKKYENYNNFENVIKRDYELIKGAYLNKYLINEHDNYKEYICLDQNNRYYIFIEKEIEDYSVILDTYTIDLYEFIEKYNSSDETTKVGMNVNKILKAINEKDYKYIYSKLNETFKTNNFDTLEKFEKYMINEIYSSKVDFTTSEKVTIEKKGEIYIYRTKLKSNSNIDKEKELTVIMKINEGTNYTMSFNIQ